MGRLLAQLALGICLSSQLAFAQHNALLCWYPLNAAPNDNTGRMGPMELTNTPFQPDGGIYCNGVYIYSEDSNACEAATPELPLGVMKGFTMSVQFKVEAYPTDFRPLLIAGASYRWLGFGIMPDSTLYLTHTNGTRKGSAARFAAGTWHEALLRYDSSTSVGLLYLDDTLVCADTFALVHDNDRTISITDYSLGKAFMGGIKNLRVWADSASIFSAAERLAPRSSRRFLNNSGYPLASAFRRFPLQKDTSTISLSTGVLDENTPYHSCSGHCNRWAIVVRPAALRPT